MMPEMSRVEELVRQVREILLDWPFRHLPVLVKNPAMRGVLNERPNGKSRQEENQGSVGMPGAQAKR